MPLLKRKLHTEPPCVSMRTPLQYTSQRVVQAGSLRRIGNPPTHEPTLTKSPTGVADPPYLHEIGLSIAAAPDGTVIFN